ncbi:MAG: ATP-binding protein [Gammaproteobacteria bacterium]
MHKLYWKIFFWFWLMATLTIAGTALISTELVKETSDTLRDNNYIQTVASAAKYILRNGDEQSFLDWLDQLKGQQGISLYLFKEKTPKPPPGFENNPEFNTALHHAQEAELKTGMLRKPPFVVSEAIETDKGDRYRIVAKMPHRVIKELEYHWPIVLLRFTIAIIISGFICYFLSIYLSYPIRILQRAARRLAEGFLDTRVGHKLAERKDELSELAHEFDKMAERIEELVQSSQTLLQDISHELRSPLARLFVTIEMARAKSNEATQPELDRIEKELNRLNELIGSILSLRSLIVNQDKIKTEYLDINDLIQSIVSDANYETKQIRVKYQSKGACYLFANKSLMRSAIENIIRNAIAYTPEDTPIDVELSCESDSALVIVRDFGPGIPEGKLDHIFKPFYRVEPARSSTKKPGGYGLGLAIAAKAIAMHHGKIEAENAENGGLRVKIQLKR